MSNDKCTFDSFARELSLFYTDDELKPGLHVSFIPGDPTARYKRQQRDQWYIAIHRYPYVNERRDERAIVCNVSRPSFGVALLWLYKQWLGIRDTNHGEEILNANDAQPHNAGDSPSLDE